MRQLTVVYDACVLYPAPLRDLLMHLATSGLFSAKWTDAIHDEWMRNVLKNRGDISRKQLERTRLLMDLSVQDSLVKDFEELIPSLALPDPDDRHVLAAAIRAAANTIVTYNLKDFPSAIVNTFGITAQHPDQFVKHLLEHSPQVVCAAVKRQRQNLLNPPKTVEEFLETLERQTLPLTVASLRQFIALI